MACGLAPSVVRQHNDAELRLCGRRTAVTRMRKLSIHTLASSQQPAFCWSKSGSLWISKSLHRVGESRVMISITVKFTTGARAMVGLSLSSGS